MADTDINALDRWFTVRLATFFTRSTHVQVRRCDTKEDCGGGTQQCSPQQASTLICWATVTCRTIRFSLRYAFAKTRLRQR